MSRDEWAERLRDAVPTDDDSPYAVDAGTRAKPQSDGDTAYNRVSRVSEHPAPMDPAAHHGIVGDFVRLVGPETEGDPAGLVIGLLVAAGHAIGRTAHAQVGPVRHHANLFAVVVGGSGAAGRKGTAHGEPARLLRLAARSASDCIKTGVVSGEGIIWNIRDPSTGTDKKTGAPVTVDEGIADKRLLLREPEFASVLRVAGRDTNTTSTTLRDAWDSPPRLQTMAKTSPAVATAPHISMLGDITPDELRRELTSTDRANGFANRILWVAVRRARQLPDGGNVDPGALAGLAARFGEAIEAAQQFDRIGRDADARALWHERYPHLTRERPGLLGALLARAEAQTLRLSLVYAVLDGSQTIRREHLRAALAVWDYCERSAAHIFGDALGDPLADELLAMLCATPAGLTRNEIRDRLGRNRPSDAITRALISLERHRLARAHRESTGGRPAERWHATETEEPR